ncbi:hypothetical protein ILYODFUR_037275 [Ilyodon furcidens]|uniref:Sushi domain-containing protein n=1 Tax=Ilyodon furcidens TaxID=33524 RepID=A0ABV0VMY0_9TELE
MTVSPARLLFCSCLLLRGGMEGSVMTYHCDPGKFPFPVSYRVCSADGDWSPLRLPSGRPVSRPICKDMLCPGQLQLDNGEFWPRNQWFQVGTTQSFSCQEGFSLYGSAQRNCTLSGEWTGATPICDDHGEEMIQRLLTTLLMNNIYAVI